MDLREIECDGMDCINLAQDRDQWRALVFTIMNFRVNKRDRFSVTTTTMISRFIYVSP
jgi:hypothetical protein